MLHPTMLDDVRLTMALFEQAFGFSNLSYVHPKCLDQAIQKRKPLGIFL